eukprot:evm.model.scf_2298.3 EVM.evm.TU.scf_2298.3   scf_2298:24623-25021(-)
MDKRLQCRGSAWAAGGLARGTVVTLLGGGPVGGDLLPREAETGRTKGTRSYAGVCEIFLLAVSRVSCGLGEGGAGGKPKPCIASEPGDGLSSWVGNGKGANAALGRVRGVLDPFTGMLAMCSDGGARAGVDR